MPHLVIRVNNCIAYMKTKEKESDDDDDDDDSSCCNDVYIACSYK